MLATGVPLYGRMAFNLAATIRAVSDIPIALVCDDSAISHLSQNMRSLFNLLIPAKGRAFAGKLDIAELSPFKKTLYIDVDTIWLPGKTPESVIDKCDGFRIITEGFYDYESGEDKSNQAYYFWCNPIEAKEKYKFQASRFWKTRSELIYFDKAGIKIINDARKIYSKPGIEFRSFVGSTPDELAFNISIAKNNWDLAQWEPSYWPGINRKPLVPVQLFAEYTIYSCGGHGATSEMKNTYNRIVKSACNKIGHQFLFPLMAKSSVIKERLING